nr:MAG TPA: hypothetical protein [Caudoviricetes sp.]
MPTHFCFNTCSRIDTPLLSNCQASLKNLAPEPTPPPSYICLLYLYNIHLHPHLYLFATLKIVLDKPLNPCHNTTVLSLFSRL